MKATLYIQNLKCSGCETTILDKLLELNGISNVMVNHQYATVTFDYTRAQDILAVKRKLSKLGYPPFGENNRLLKKATSYVSCAIGKVSQKD